MKKKSILLIGLGHFGVHIAEKLRDLGHEVTAVDRDEKRVNDVMPIVTNGLIGDSTDPAFLKTLGIPHYDLAVVAIGGDFQSSLETTCLLKEMGAKTVVSRAERDGQAKFLLRNGADEIVYPEQQLAGWLAIRYTSDHLLDYIELDPSCSIFEVTVPQNWLGKSIGELDVRKKYAVNIVAIREDGKVNLSFTPYTVLNEHQTLYVIGEYKALKKCFKI